MLSGFAFSMSAKRKRRIKRELKKYGGESKTISIPALPIKDLLKDHHINDIDYLNIDVEGGEREVLSSIDFRSVTINCIGIENDYFDPYIYRKLKEHNFVYIGKVGDDFFIHKSILASLPNKWLDSIDNIS